MKELCEVFVNYYYLFLLMPIYLSFPQVVWVRTTQWLVPGYHSFSPTALIYSPSLPYSPPLPHPTTLTPHYLSFSSHLPQLLPLTTLSHHLSSCTHLSPTTSHPRHISLTFSSPSPNLLLTFYSPAISSPSTQPSPTTLTTVLEYVECSEAPKDSMLLCRRCVWCVVCGCRTFSC